DCSLSCPGLGQQGLEFATGQHFANDIGAADEFASNIQLGNGGPVGIFLNALTNFFVVKHVHSDELGSSCLEQRLNGATRKPALRKLGRALHEQHHGVGCNGFTDEILDFAHGG